MRKLLFLLILLLLLPPWAECSGDAAPERVVSEVVFDYPGVLPGGVRELAGIKKGDVYSPRKVRDSIKLIYLKGAFEDISVEGRDTDAGAGVVITYHLKPRLRISKIKLIGNDEVGKKKIMPQLVFKEGDFVDPALIKKSSVGILKLYQEEGFRKAAVDILPQKINSLQAVV